MGIDICNNSNLVNYKFCAWFELHNTIDQTINYHSRRTLASPCANPMPRLEAK